MFTSKTELNELPEIFYSNRKERARFVAEVFAEELTSAACVLDVGCSNGELRAFLPEAIKYVGIDINGSPSCFVNLEGLSLPFIDASFDMIVCTDVLEHVDSIYRLFHELLRCSRKHIILSLPNMYAMFLRRRIMLGKPLKFYGLPPEMPQDRHKWFFSLKEAKVFMQAQVDLSSDWAIAKAFPHFGEKTGLTSGIINRIFQIVPHRIDNLFAQAYWWLLTRKRLDLSENVYTTELR